jgi:ribosome-binding protein aMBF1 (putative translation factor)
MEHCIRCKISESEVKLYDSVYEGRNSLICERCAIIENIPVITKSDPVLGQEKPTSVIERLRRLTGVKETKSEGIFLKDRLEKLKEARPEKKLELREHFEWDIMRTRRRKGLSQEKLAEAVGESFSDIETLEKGELVQNSERIIKKLEQFLGVKLTKVDEFEELAKTKSRPIILRDEYGNVLDHIPEPEIIEPELEPIEEEEKYQEDEKVQEIKPFGSIFKNSFFKSKGKNTVETQDLKETEIQDTYLQEDDLSKVTQNNKVDSSDLKPYQLPYSRGRIGIKKLEEMREKERREKEKAKASLFFNKNENSRNALETEREDKGKPVELDFETGELDIEKAKLNNASIGNLRELHKQKLKLTRQDRIEEARKIEQRQRLIEARKEELRLLKERESKDVDSRLGGLELLKNRKDNRNEIEVDEVDESDESDVDEDFEKFEED